MDRIYKIKQDWLQIGSIKVFHLVESCQSCLKVLCSDLAELHWFEAHGIGKRKMRVKRFLD